MATAVRNTLLALLLALKNLDAPLNEDEREALADVGQQLKLNPEDWDFIEADLMATIEANDALSQLYRQFRGQLDAVDGQIPSDLLPTDAEIEKALPPESDREKRAYFGGQPDDKNNEILNMTISILNTPEPTETTKKLTRLEELWQFLNQPILKND